ncbi:MAG: S9 family peptidase [Elusimicrobia bacterium]|nr:S9 family peptidase [Elusimicrobiota bacterium]
MDRLIQKYLDALPYSEVWVARDDRTCFFIRDMESQKKLHRLDLSRSLDLDDGELVSEEDFNKRTHWPLDYDPRRRMLYFISDTDNREDLNIYVLPLDRPEIKKLTDCARVGLAGCSPDFRRLVYTDRWKVEDGLFFSRLKILDMERGEGRAIVSDDEWEYRFWIDGRPLFSLDRGNVVVPVDRDSQRRKFNLLLVDLENGSTRRLLPPEEETTSLQTLGEEFGPEGFYFVSDVMGFENVHFYDLALGKSRPLSLFHRRNNGLALVRRVDGKLLVAVLPDPENDSTEVWARRVAGAVPADEPFSMFARLPGAWFWAGNQQEVWLSCSTLDNPVTRHRFLPGKADLKPDTRLAIYRGDRERIVHNTYRFVKYPSFDGKTIPSYLSLPKAGLRGAVIIAFYGGQNSYDYETQMFSELGLAVLSPAVRGSWGFGKEWEALLKGDLGGNEILDIVWGARYLEKELGLKPGQIGVFGGSHGGFAVLRALTMPDGFSGQASKYPFGFGISWAGFADLEEFHRSSNVPDWLTDLLGPYKDNRDKHRDRSPLNHFEELQAPIFVVHGANDARVPPSTMEGFLEKLESSGKPHEIYRLEGQGHTSGSHEEKRRVYRAMLGFIDRLFSRREPGNALNVLR